MHLKRSKSSFSQAEAQGIEADDGHSEFTSLNLAYLDVDQSTSAVAFIATNDGTNIPGVPEAPVLSGSVVGRSAVLRWEPTAKNIMYRLEAMGFGGRQVSEDERTSIRSDGWTTLYLGAGMYGEFTQRGLEEERSYNFRLSACNSNGWSRSSKWVSLSMAVKEFNDWGWGRHTTSAMYQDSSEGTQACTGTELAELTFLPSSSFKSPEVSKQHATAWDMNSTSEKVISQRWSVWSTQLVAHCSRQLLRMFPAAARQDSSNYSPMMPWAHGLQCVALNFQTQSQPMDLNR